jgi:hypothetical protein
MFDSILTGPPFDLTFENQLDGPGGVISVPIARSDDLNRVVFVETLLGPAMIDGLEHGEISFQIKVICMDESLPDVVTQDRNDAIPFIPEEIRDSILNIVCLSCAKLLGTLDFTCIYYVTKAPYLPDKAMRKYELLTEAVQGCGYVIYERGTDPSYRPFWKLRRTTD